MTERWIQVIIEPTDSIWLEEVREVIYQAIRNLVAELGNELQSFHFFHEYGNVELRLRIDASATSLQIQAVEDVIDKHFGHYSDVIKEYIFYKYEPELEQYGKDGWPVAQAFFEACSRFVLADFDSKADLGDWYSIGKMAHCLMNQYFANRNHEAQFYADELCRMNASGYRITVAYDGAWKDEIKRAWTGHGWGDWETRQRHGKNNDEQKTKMSFHNDKR